MTEKRASDALISVLVPVYNEEANIEPFIARVSPVLDQIESEFGYRTELVFTDNASTDGTFEKIIAVIARDSRIRIYRFSINVGFQRSIISGYSRLRGNAAIQIDCDLEDPPEIIVEFIRKWVDGYDVVYGVRRARQESFVRRALRAKFYSFLNFLSEHELPEHAGDFRLIDRKIIDIVCQINDAQPYIRGFIASLGHKQTGITYDRDRRHAGASSFNLVSYASMALDGIIQTSVRPLYISLGIGFAGFALVLLLIAYYIASALIYGIEVAGFLSLIILQLVTLSSVTFFLGIIGLYVGRIYRQVVKRPWSVIELKAETSGGDVQIRSVDSRHAVHWPGLPVFEISSDEKPSKTKSRTE